jgi:crossover junction endodeoxyribonuclease RusA
MTPVTFRKMILPYPPSANMYWRHCRGRIFVSSDARRYRDKAARIASASGIRMLTGPVAVAVDVFRPKRIGDLDNTLKVMLDSMRGIIFKDDSQVTEIMARRFDDKENPRAEITITALENPKATGQMLFEGAMK